MAVQCQHWGAKVGEMAREKLKQENEEQYGKLFVPKQPEPVGIQVDVPCNT